MKSTLISLFFFGLMMCAPAKLVLEDSYSYYQEIKFVNKLSRIDDESFIELRKLARIFKAFPQAKIQIMCYVYSDRDRVSNHILANRRAKEVKQFLVGEDVEYDQLITRGYGNKNPILDEGGKVDIEKSNRLEFIRINK